MIRHLRLPYNEKLLLPILLEELLDKYGDRPVSAHDDLRGFDGAPQREQSLAELVDEVSALCRFLRTEVGLERGERVAIYKSNDARCFRWFLAVIRAGGIAVPINPLLSFTEAQRIIGECAAIAMVTDSTVIGPHLHELASLAAIQCIQDVGESLIPGFVQPTSDLLGAPALPAVDVGLDETIAVMYSSGTLGKPSGATLSSRSCLAGRPLASIIRPLVRKDDLALFPLPWAHVFAVTTAILGLLAGVPAYFMTRFEARRAIDIISGRRITAFVGVPAMLVKLIEAQPGTDRLRSVRLWVSASDRLPPGCRDQLMKYGASLRLCGKRLSRPLLVNAYGMVELGGIAMVSVDGPLIPGRGELCIPLPHIRVRIVDEQGEERPRGLVGECLVKSAGNVSGYWQTPDATERITTPDGWVRTGDLAKRTRGGFIKLTGRAKDVIKSGGYLVHPQDIEDVISSHPLVSRVVAVGIPHRQLGEIPVAVVESGADAKRCASEVLEWCRTRLAAFALPREIYVVKPGEIPEGPTNKALRGAVRGKLVAASIDWS
jgi:acyl-CoA synthetase (AMP-forming)/AMP-acid ligase II